MALQPTGMRKENVGRHLEEELETKHSFWIHLGCLWVCANFRLGKQGGFSKRVCRGTQRGAWEQNMVHLFHLENDISVVRLAKLLAPLHSQGAITQASCIRALVLMEEWVLCCP